MARPLNRGKANNFREKPEETPKEQIPPPITGCGPDMSDTKNLKNKKKERKPRRVKQPPTAAELASREKWYRVFGLFCLLFALYLTFSFTSYLLTWQSDFSFADTIFKHFSVSHLLDNSEPSENWMGKIGALTGYLFISRWFGISSYLIILVLLNTGLRHFFHMKVFPLWKTAGYALLILLWAPLVLNLVQPAIDIYSGGYGFQVNLWLTDFLGSPGLVLFLIFTGFSFLILSFNIPFRWFARETSPEVETAAETVMQASELPVNPSLESESEPEGSSPTSESDIETTLENAGPIELEIDTPVPPRTTETTNPPLVIEPPAETNDTGKSAVPPLLHNGPDSLYDPTLDLSSYVFPTLDLLKDYGGDQINVRKEELESNKDKIVQTLGNYDIKIARIKATIGPAVTLYEIVPEAGVRISRIKNLEDDIALSLAAMGIRIIAPIPGKGTIGIEVPNQNPDIVSIKSLLASEKFRNSTFELPFVLGKTIANETFIADLAKMPHLLMAGATGQGKSVGLNTIITSLLYKKHPALIKFVLIDPKKVELTLYKKLERHFLAKLPDADESIITDTKKVIRTLNSLSIEMGNRYDLLQAAQVRSIKEYNEKFLARKLNPVDGHQFLPYIVIVIDEFADLIMTAGKEIETPLTRLAQLARATGIHLIIATQRPSVNIITGTIKANFPARIAFRVISKIDSRTILDSSGADQLIGRGDMLLSTGSDLIRLQCAFVDTPEIESVTEFIGAQRGYPEAFPLPEFYDEENTPTKDFDPNEKDEFFGEAARLVVQHQHGSTSLIQRKLKLGYNRAGRIIDQLENAGIVGPFEGSKAREVLYKDLNSLEEHLNLLGK